MSQAASTSAWAPYCGAAPAPAELLSRWNFDPLLLLAIAGMAVSLHLATTSAESRRRTSAAAAIGVLLLLFVSPFCALTSALFSARVVHHVALVAVAAPLLAWSLGDRIRVRGSLAAWTVVHSLVFWLWHSPPLYAAALSNDAIYWLMQLTLLGSAFAFWASLRCRSAPAAVAALLAMVVQMGLLGALITFSGTALYAPHFASTAPWGLTPLEDQQLAGLIMWAPSAGFYLAAALLLASRWIRREEHAEAASA